MISTYFNMFNSTVLLGSQSISESHGTEADGTSGSQAYSPWMTSLCTCAALDLRPERGNQGAVYGTMAFTFHRSALTFHAVIF